jgi:hypothetical protein
LNFKFSQLGDYLGRVKDIPPEFLERQTSSAFSFRFVTEQECRRVLKDLNPSKPLGPSDIPAWALRDAADEITIPLTQLVNAFIAE